jgi:subtilisin family serine protease
MGYSANPGEGKGSSALSDTAQNIVKLTSHAAASSPSIPQEIVDKIFADGEAEFFVVLKAQADISAARRLQGKESKGSFVFGTLKGHAESAQKSIRTWLDGRGVKYRPFWIRNMVLVTGDLEVLLELAARPDVAEIRPNRIANFINSVQGGESNGGSGTLAAEWNLVQIQADRVWNELGVTGEGIVVMDTDTGVQWTHPALKGHYRGWNGTSADHNYNWYDPGNTYPTEPGDNNGHGTHTTGTMVGDDGGSNKIGVAPGAKWIACKACASNSCSDSDILACF